MLVGLLRLGSVWVWMNECLCKGRGDCFRGVRFYGGRVPWSTFTNSFYWAIANTMVVRLAAWACKSWISVC